MCPVPIHNSIQELKKLIAGEIKGGYLNKVSSGKFGSLITKALATARREIDEPDALEIIDFMARIIRGYLTKIPLQRQKIIKELVIQIKKLEAGRQKTRTTARKEKSVVRQPLATLKEHLSNIKGVGPSRARTLSRLNLQTIEDLLYYFPRYYLDRTQIKPVRNLEEGKEQTVSVVLINWEKDLEKRGLTISKALFKDASGYIFGVWFNQPYIKKSLSANSALLLSGRVERFGSQWQMISPEWELMGAEEPLEHGRIVPVYPLTSGLNQRFMRNLTHRCLNLMEGQIKDCLPGSLKDRLKLISLDKALKEMHFPQDSTFQKQARFRLAFEELFLLQLKIMQRKEEIKTSSALPLSTSGLLLEPYIKNLPFALTADQARCLQEIKEDLAKPVPMNRLFHGEVGSGKTVVALAAAIIAIENQVQVAFMAPTEVLALQHFAVIKELLPKEIDCSLLIGSTPHKERREILESLSSGRKNLLVGTHALLQEDVSFHKLGLVIIDEQHRFGVTQRWKMKTKGENPHLLVISATPIPRTLTLTLYGDLEISSLRNLPQDRGKVKTIWVGSESRNKVYGFLREQVKRGRQAYVICPTIEESPQLEIKAVTSLFEDLKEGILSDLRLALIHGRLPTRQVDKIMEEFKQGEVDVLISTSIIEVGVDVKNATFLVVEDAQRFGLSQLHQLRGRVRRGMHDAYCFLISDPANEEAIKRLKVITSTVDGFMIAEEDLKIRGSGELLGLRQHGLSELKVANPLQDLDILELAKREVFDVLQNDPNLMHEANQLLKKFLSRYLEKVDLARI